MGTRLIFRDLMVVTDDVNCKHLSDCVCSEIVKGVRDHIELIKKMSMMMPDLKSELKESVEDGLSRYPDWPELTKVKKWLEF